MMPDVLYYLMVGAFFAHELDAVNRHEWRMMPGLRALPDEIAGQAYIWLHLPVFAFLLAAGDGETVNRVRVAFSVFAVLHIALHWHFRNHPANEFNTPGAWSLILGTGALGTAYLLSTIAA